jgi:bifunctional non-homologous end joining protein LigD
MAVRTVDGFRAVAYLTDGECRLVSRKDRTYKSFAPLRAALGEQLRAENAILDGEIVCLDQEGRSIFNVSSSCPTPSARRV